MKICSIENCNKPVKALNYCCGHYKRFKSYGDPLIYKNKPATEKQIIQHSQLNNVWLVELSQGEWALVDDTDIKRVSKYSWSITTKAGYAQAGRIKNNPVLMHRFILDFPDGEIDHINHNKLDNRRSNLRICSHEQNSYNTKLRSDSTTSFKGVSFDKSRNRFCSFINQNSSRYFLGYFSTPEEAAEAYDEKAIELFGEFAYLNFPHH